MELCGIFLGVVGLVLIVGCIEIWYRIQFPHGILYLYKTTVTRATIISLKKFWLELIIKQSIEQIPGTVNNLQFAFLDPINPIDFILAFGGGEFTFVEELIYFLYLELSFVGEFRFQMRKFCVEYAVFLGVLTLLGFGVGLGWLFLFFVGDEFIFMSF